MLNQMMKSDGENLISLGRIPRGLPRGIDLCCDLQKDHGRATTNVGDVQVAQCATLSGSPPGRNA
jgi:hypothetical protein